MTYTTLTYSGVEKSLADWGIDEAGCTLNLVNLERDIFKVSVVKANVFDAAIWPFLGAIVVKSGRALDTETGAWSGGVIEFSGKRLLEVLDGRPDFEGVYYSFAGPWLDLEVTPYQQTSAWWLGPTDDTATLDLSSDVLLFAKVITVDGFSELTWVTTGVQITDTLQHVLDQYTARGLPPPFQIGTIDVVVPLPMYPMRDVKCSEVIEYCLRPSPDARLWFDYSTAPPTANVTSRASCTPVTIALADGVAHESVRITPRPDLQAASVVIFFLQTNTVNNISRTLKYKQKYGAHGLNSSLDPDGGPYVVAATVDLQGSKINYVYGQLTTVPVANTLDFWLTIVPELRSTQVRSFATLGALTVVDDSGAALDLGTYPNALMDGSSVCPWMTLPGGASVNGVRATIWADVSYKLYDVDATGGDRSATNGNLLETFPKKRLLWRGIITNGVTGPYQAQATAVWPQAIPDNLAQFIFTSLATLQYDGEVSIVQPEISGGINMGNVLNLSGGRAEWATMNAQIQSILKEFGTGRIVGTIGPARFLSAGDLTQLFLVNRYRRVYENPLARQTGLSNQSESGIAMANSAVKENTNTGLSAKAFLRLLFTQPS